MSFFAILLFTTIFYTQCSAQSIYVSDVNIRIEPGSKTCLYETGKAGQMMEVYFQVLDGQHGDLDISFQVIDPNNVTIVSHYKSPENSIIMDLIVGGDYSFCLDNTYSLMNSKLVFIYILLEDKIPEHDGEAEVTTVDANGEEQGEELEWEGVDEHGEKYFLKVANIADSLSLTLSHVVKSRRLLDIYAATKSRDSYMAFEDTFIVDAWSAFQITLLLIVGMIQVYMIKKLFVCPNTGYKSVY